MGKGILAVGFPDSSHVQPGSQLSQRVENDKAKLRQLIYSCDQKANIPQTFPVLKGSSLLCRSIESAQDPAFQHTEAGDTVIDLSRSIRIHQISRRKSQFKT